jgi:hypothetical protein
VFFDDNTIGIAAIGDASKVYVWRVVGEGHVGTELLETGLALGAVAVGVNQAADCSKVAGLEPGDCGADLGDTTDDFMSWNAGIDSGRPAPLITDLVEVRVADTAEKDFDLNVVFAWVTPGDRRGC